MLFLIFFKPAVVLLPDLLFTFASKKKKRSSGNESQSRTWIHIFFISLIWTSGPNYEILYSLRQMLDANIMSRKTVSLQFYTISITDWLVFVSTWQLIDTRFRNLSFIVTKCHLSFTTTRKLFTSWSRSNKIKVVNFKYCLRHSLVYVRVLTQSIIYI
jgi:hypothetical protein